MKLEESDLEIIDNNVDCYNLIKNAVYKVCLENNIDVSEYELSNLVHQLIAAQFP